jgi:CDGSH-type Zn-finger protein
MNDIYAGDKAMRLNLGIRRRLAPWFDRRQSSENSNRAERRLEPKVFRRRSSETVCAIDRRPSLWLCGSPRVVANQPFCPQRDGTHHRRSQNDSCARKRIDWVSIQPITGILAYVRQLGDETIRVVNHLSNAAQAVGLDLRRVNIRIERFGKNIFPRVVKCPTC